MLYQMHHQFLAEGKTEMVAQKDINDIVEMKNWQVEVTKDNPLPKNAKWMVCNEQSEFFVWAVKFN